MSNLAGKEVEELAHVARVGLDRLVRRRTLVAKVSQPPRHGLLEVRSEGKIRAIEAGFGHGGSLG